MLVSIFYVGGPGTSKGKILANLMQMYNINFVNVEVLVRDELYKMVLKRQEEEKEMDMSEANVDTEYLAMLESRVKAKRKEVNAMKKIKKFVYEEPESLTCDNLFNLIGNEVAKFPAGSTVIVDLIPNHRFLHGTYAFSQNVGFDDAIKRFGEKVCILKSYIWNIMILPHEELDTAGL